MRRRIEAVSQMNRYSSPGWSSVGHPDARRDLATRVSDVGGSSSATARRWSSAHVRQSNAPEQTSWQRDGMTAYIGRRPHRTNGYTSGRRRRGFGGAFPNTGRSTVWPIDRHPKAAFGSPTRRTIGHRRPTTAAVGIGIRPPTEWTNTMKR